MKAHLIDLLAKAPGYRLLKEFRDRRAFRAARAEDADRRAFYAQFIQPNDLVFDVGANQGNRSRVFLDLGARVVAFEPQRTCADYLSNVLRGEPRFEVVRKALGAQEGQAEMYISNAHTISSLSPDWIDATRRSGRFNQFTWATTQIVEVTTLDRTIARHGRPAFVKIDVEGFEHEVLAGLSVPVTNLSFEFTFEFMQSTLRCIDQIERLSAAAKFQYSIGESMRFALDDWITADQLRTMLANFRRNEAGDIYVHCE